MKRRFKPLHSTATIPIDIAQKDFLSAQEVADTKIGEQGIYLRASFDFLAHPYVRLKDIASVEAGSVAQSGSG
ncbi:MAG: hypothetical protein ACOX4F_07155 [Atopobiaceae bacterium]|jgi:hypothetical protein